MNTVYRQKKDPLKYDKYLQGLERKGLWKNIVEDIREKYYMDYQGVIHVWKVTKDSHVCDK